MKTTSTQTVLQSNNLVDDNGDQRGDTQQNDTGVFEHEVCLNIGVPPT